MNQELLTKFQKDIVLDSNSIHILPAYFNFIECYLANNSEPEVKKYLTVALSNLSFSNKKKEDGKELESAEDFEEESLLVKDKQTKTSRINLLFGQYLLLTAKYKEAKEKIILSIILYSEIYGPEFVGLTPNYYYLASCFLSENSKISDNSADSLIVSKNIYLKIADCWKKYFLGEKHELFDTNVDHKLNLNIGKYYVNLIISKIGTYFKSEKSEDKELELILKYLAIRVLILKELKLEYSSHLVDFDKKKKELLKRERDEWLRIYELEKKRNNPENDEAKDKEILGGIIFLVDDKYKLIDKDFFDSLDKIIHSSNTVLNVEFD